MVEGRGREGLQYLHLMSAYFLPQSLAQRSNDMEWNGDSSREAEMEVVGGKCVQRHSVVRGLSGLEVGAEVTDGRQKLFRKLNCFVGKMKYENES